MFYIVLIIMFLLAAFYISTPEKEDEDISKVVVHPPTNAMIFSDPDIFNKVQSVMGEYRDVLEQYDNVPMTLGLAEFMMLPEEEKNEEKLIELLEKRKDR